MLQNFQSLKRKSYLVKILEESDYDLQYAAIRAIGYLQDIDVLYPLKNVVYAKDYITRRAAILSVVRIADSVKEEEQSDKLTPHIHILIESYLELEQVGEIICKIMDYGNQSVFPDMKGYTESEIVKLEGLIEQKDYSVEMYQNFARLIFPVYFPLQEENN
ncbi:MAG: HEAT repeat domain-containing protein [Candidatus Heimdallarchaeaceae archaeon]